MSELSRVVPDYVFQDNLAIAVDDNEMTLLLIESMSQSMGLPIRTFQRPSKARDFMQSNSIDIAFVDYQMPEINGIQLTSMIRESHPSIPIIMITGEEETRDLKLRAIEAGATDFMEKPFNTYEFIARVKNLLQLRKFQIMHLNRAALLEKEISESVHEIAKREYEALTVLGRASEYKDTETGNHVKRVAFYSRLMAEKMGQGATIQETIYHASPLHDIGKMGIPDRILLKPGKLDKDEFEVMKTHAEIGYEILKDCKSLYLQAGAQIARSHHEKFDGSGYPHGLKGAEIPILGRIIAVVDVFDALTSKRPYKKPWPFDLAVREVKAGMGSHFDPDVVKAFLGSILSVRAIMEQFSD